MSRYNAQILNDKGEYHLQFETDNKEHFDAVEKMVQKCIDNKPLTNFNQITQSVDSLANFLRKVTDCCQFDKCPDCPLEEALDCTTHYIAEWLQQEAANDHNSLN